MTKLIRGLWMDRWGTVDAWRVIGHGLHERTCLTMKNWYRIFNICSTLMDLDYLLDRVQTWLRRRNDPSYWEELIELDEEATDDW